MSKISAVFSDLKQAGKKGLVPFITAGDPEPGLTVALMHALVRGGANVIELGVPFSDPMADGPVIQRSSERALSQGVTLRHCLGMVKAFRETDTNTPVVLMGYANPMTIRGGDWFASECNKAGVDGVICVDIPPEEDPELGPALRSAGIDLIRLATPTTDTARLPAVLDGASGFLYYVSVAGITGLQVAAQTSIDEAVARLKAHTDLPIAVGFGVRTPEQAANIARVADGVVVGSAIVELVAKHGVNAAGPVRDYVASLKSAIISARG